MLLKRYARRIDSAFPAGIRGVPAIFHRYNCLPLPNAQWLGASSSLYDSTQDDHLLYLDTGINELRSRMTTTNGHAKWPGVSRLLVNMKLGH